jgi:hypothetical protein
MGSGERAGKRASFNGAAKGNSSGIGRGGSPNHLREAIEAIEVNRPYLI